MLLPAADNLDLSTPLSQFEAEGYARLGSVLSAAGIEALRQRSDALMTGSAAFPGVFYQHDAPSGHYEDLTYAAGWIGPSRAYRKLEGLQVDATFRAWIENALFERIARQLLGASVTLYRIVLWNKAAHGGTELPWHQDDGKFWGIDQRPSLQIWTALDDAPLAAGCLDVVPGTHHDGLASPEGGTVQRHRLDALNAQVSSTPLPARAGEAILLHNHTWHRSGVNQTDAPRRALSISYLEGSTRCLRRRRAPRQFTPVFAGDQD